MCQNEATSVDVSSVEPRLVHLTSADGEVRDVVRVPLRDVFVLTEYDVP